MDFTVLEARRYSSPGSSAPLREVKDYEIDMECLDERIYTCASSVREKLTRGDILIRKPHDRVCSEGKQESYILTLDFSGKEVPEIYSRNVLGEFQAPIKDECIANLPSIIHPRDINVFSYIYQRLTTFSDKNSPAAKALVKELVYALNAEVAHCDYEKLKPSDDVAFEVISYMQKNLQKEITLEELAAIAHLEKSYFVRSFKAATGKTPIEMLIGFRMEKASDLITNTNLKISEIAELCGYKILSFFISEYKKRYLQTPTEQRRAVREKQLSPAHQSSV